ncbi:MAG: aldolase/citrate lyase family protein [Candidatus Dormibacter sp.]
MNSMLHRLRAGPLLGTFLKVPRPEIVEMLGVAGLHFVICDIEHGQITEREARDVVLAGRATGVDVVVRVAGADRGQINRLLEAGAAGIQQPHVNATAEANALADIMRYPPAGSRSISLAQPAAGFGTEPLAGYLSRAQQIGLRVGQLETATFTDPLEDIVAALDVAFIGTLDLSLDAGAPGRFGEPAVSQVVAAIEAAAATTDTILGGHATSVEAAIRMLGHGYRYVVVGSDVAFFMDGTRRALDGVVHARSAQ